MPVLVRHITPVSRKAASGQVAAVYRHIAADLGLVAPPYLMLSPAPDLLAATWALAREAQAAGQAPRAAKEAVAVAVSQANRCPYCVDAHSLFLNAAGQSRLAGRLLRGERPTDPALAALVDWAAQTSVLNIEVTAAPPFGREVAPEYVGTVLAYHFINRMVSALLPERLLPGPSGLSRLAGLLAGIALARTVRRRVRPGDSLALLHDAPADLPGWAGQAPAGRAYAALKRAAVAGGDLLAEPARRHLKEAVATWDGTHPPLSAGWLDAHLAPLDVSDRPGARLALLAAFAPYRITDADVAAWRIGHRADAELVRVLAYGAIAAVERIETGINAALGLPPWASSESGSATCGAAANEWPASRQPGP